MSSEGANMGILGSYDLASFSNNFWGFSPLFVQDSIPQVAGMFRADEIIETAGSDEVLSGILITPPEGDWTVAAGPFDPDLLSPDEYWTLTLRELERHYPELDEILAEFSFIPNWRKDDLILNYSTAGMVNGPYLNDRHRFLICVDGIGEWECAHAPRRPEYIEGLPAEVVAEFQPNSKFTASPGSLLYLPPQTLYRVSSEQEHIVLALTCYSPTRSSLLSSLIRACPDMRLEMKPEEEERGLLSSRAITQVKTFLQSLLEEPEFDRWLGSHLTASVHSLTYPAANPLTVRQFRGYSQKEEVAYRSHRVRWTYTDDPDPMLFVDGRSYEVSAEVARLIVDSQPLELEKLRGEEELLCDLYNLGFIEFSQEDEEAES